MSAERAIHEHWSGYRPLLNLVPAERIYTGLPPIRAADGSTVLLPYVSLTVQGESQIERSSSGTTYSLEQVRFAVYSANYDEARRLEAAIVNHFNRRDFDWADGRVLDMQPGDRIERENAEDGVWMAARDFNVRIVNCRSRISA
jgi:hypothetical protein